MVGLFDHRRLDVSMCTLYPHGPNRHTFFVDLIIIIVSSITAK